MNAIRALAVTASLAGVTLAQQPSDAVASTITPRPIAFAEVDRDIGKLPELVAAEPLYGMFLFGHNGEHRVWAVLDKSTVELDHYDVLYIDRNADGDLTARGERIAAELRRTGAKRENVHARFAIGDFRDPGSKAVHEQFELSWRKDSVRFKMLWRGDKVTMGSYGPTRDTYQNFRSSPATAPIFVPGYDRPFEFQHWMCDRLPRGGATDFKVFVGNRGDRTGAFACVDQDFLTEHEYVQATLLYRDTDDEQQSLLVKLTRRC